MRGFVVCTAILWLLAGTTRFGAGLLNGAWGQFMPAQVEEPRVTSTLNGEAVLACDAFGQPLSTCIFTKDGNPSIAIFISASQDKDGAELSVPGYFYKGNGFPRGECGLWIRNVKESDNGQWNCKLITSHGLRSGAIQLEILKTCKSYQFECGNGQCVDRAYNVCNRYKDCTNGEDEERCNGTCADYLFQCANGKCIPTHHLCNGFDHCGDNSDEDYCTKIDGCFPHKFRCGDGQCVPKRWVCDEETSGCDDESNMLNCEASANGTCPDFMFQCRNGKCMPQVRVCNGFDDCGDNSDEYFCRTSQKCPPSTFQCESGGCLSYRGVCNDRYGNCTDGSDNKFCNGTCPENYFRCLSGHCIPSRWRCDGFPQCDEGSDEFHCPRIMQPVGNADAVEGTEFTLSCIVSGDPEPVVTWSKDGAGLIEKGIIIVTSGYLKIANVTATDAGNYTCSAANKYATVSDMGSLHVSSWISAFARIPWDLHGDCGGDKVNLRWKLEQEKVPPVFKYTIEFQATWEPDTWKVVEDNVPPSANNLTFSLLSLRPGIAYHFTVAAWNQFGRSARPNATVTCKTPPNVPFRNPTNVNGHLNFAGTLVVSWTPMPRIDHNGPGFHYRVSWRLNEGKEPWSSKTVPYWDAESTIIQNLNAYKIYVARVIAVNDEGESNREPEEVAIFFQQRDPINWFLFIGVPLLIAVPMSIIITLAVWYLRESERRQQLETKIQEFMEGNKNTELEAATPVGQAVFKPFTATLDENEVTVDYNKLLGCGNFGNIFAGKYKDTQVAVKIVKPGSPMETFQKFFTEMKIMAYIGHHDNIVWFIGAVTSKLTEKKILAVMELSPRGCLEKYLRDHETYGRENYANIPGRNVDHVEPLPTSTLISFCRQIAKGMQYLMDLSVIHGDLATRNVLVFDNDVVKISDFGFSRNTYGYGKYKQKRTIDIPYRWAALETIQNNVFSHEADVWSYGVTMWEVFTLGHFPFAMHPMNDFAQQIRDGLRLKKPERVPDSIYNDLMLKCWNLSPDARPTFIEIIGTLDDYERCP